MKISLVAAFDRDRAIGKDGDIPWRGKLPGDLKRFRKLTMGGAVIMGRKTWDSLPEEHKPLLGRKNIVLTRDKGFRANGCTLVDSVEKALLAAEDKKEIFVIGGSEIYELFMPKVDTMYLTFVYHSFGGDTFFPEFPCENWYATDIVNHEKNYKVHYKHSFVTLKRRG